MSRHFVAGVVSGDECRGLVAAAASLGRQGARAGTCAASLADVAREAPCALAPLVRVRERCRAQAEARTGCFAGELNIVLTALVAWHPGAAIGFHADDVRYARVRANPSGGARAGWVGGRGGVGAVCRLAGGGAALALNCCPPADCLPQTAALPPSSRGVSYRPMVGAYAAPCCPRNAHHAICGAHRRGWWRWAMLGAGRRAAT